MISPKPYTLPKTVIFHLIHPLPPALSLLRHSLASSVVVPALVQLEVCNAQRPSPHPPSSSPRYTVFAPPVGQARYRPDILNRAFTCPALLCPAFLFLFSDSVWREKNSQLTTYSEENVCQHWKEGRSLRYLWRCLPRVHHPPPQEGMFAPESLKFFRVCMIRVGVFQEKRRETI